MNTNDLQAILNVAFTLGAAAGGWFAREMWSAVKGLTTDLANLRAELPKTYLSKDDYRQDLQRIEVMLNRILDKIDSKADKT